MNKKIVDLEKDIRQAEMDFQAFLNRQEAERQTQEKQRDEKIASLMEERNRLALAEKLKDYPPALVKSHKVCSVCGAQMRPFKVARDGQTQKIWACQAGGLSDVHDLVMIE